MTRAAQSRLRPPADRPRATAGASAIAAFAGAGLFLASPSAAQVPAEEPVAATLVRYDEDWSVLAAPGARTGRWVEPFKYRPATADIWATTGLELRLRSETYRGLQWGDGQDQTDVWTRALPYIDLHAGRARLFLQPIVAHAEGVRPRETPIDQTRADLLQGFLEGSAEISPHARVSLRAGRQMIVLGSQRLIGARYGPNLPLAFDGARLIVKRDQAELSLIAARPVQAGPDDFDDAPSGRKAIWSAYLTLPSLEAYYIGFEDKAGRFATQAGLEHRHSFGARSQGRTGAWRWNLEAVVQTGRIGEQRISAWTLSNEVGRAIAWEPLPLDATLRLDVVSGDKRSDDRTLNTFNALFPKGKYFGELSPIGPANIVHVSPQVSATLTPDLTVSLAAMAYWRQSRADGVYEVSGSLLRAPNGARGRFIGRQAEVVVTWQATPEWSLAGSLSAFAPGVYIRQTGASRPTYMLGLESSFRF